MTYPQVLCNKVPPTLLIQEVSRHWLPHPDDLHRGGGIEARVRLPVDGALVDLLRLARAVRLDLRFVDPVQVLGQNTLKGTVSRDGFGF
jgi:hypothetical protein